MPAGWVAAGSALLGAGASIYGSEKQAKASKAAANLNQNQFAINNAQQQPFIQSGYGAQSKLNTLLGINPNPNYRPAQPMQNPGYMPTPGGGVQPITQMGMNPQQPQQNGQSPFGIPQNAGNMNLRRILSLRAQNGDTEAARMLGVV